MTINVHRSERDKRIGKRYRLVADGIDLTNRTFYVDARRRIVKIYAKDSSGKHIINGKGELVTITLRPRRVRLIQK